MAPKTVVFYWNKIKKKPESAFLDFFLSYRKPYLDAISEFADIAIVIGEENYLGGRNFSRHYLYQNGKFIKKRKPVQANVILDRTMGFKFPESTPILDKTVINNASFKSIVRDKYVFSQKFPDHSPKSYLCENQTELKNNIDVFRGQALVVAKPLTGKRGEGVCIGSKKKVLEYAHKYPVVLQEFVETMGGFMYPDRRHDIRIVIINGKIVHAFARFTKADPYRANISQGGDYLELSYEDIPRKLKEVAENIAAEIKEKYNNPFYSIDFGISKDKVYIFEMNNKIGFPEKEKNNFKIFLAEFINLIQEKLEF